MINKRFFLYLILAGLSALAVFSCKKDDDSTDIKDYLGGDISYVFPGYVRYGQAIHVEPTGVYRPNGSDASDKSDTLLTWYWTNPFTEKADTLRKETDPDTMGKSFDFTVDRDTLGDFTMKVTVSATGYYSKVLSKAFTIVDPAINTGSLKGYSKIDSDTPFTTDARTGFKYYYTLANGLDWMIQNLAYGGVPYQNEPETAYIFGHFCNYDEALAACPEGWRLPTAAEFDALIATAGGTAGAMMEDVSFNGTDMWPYTREVKISNAVGFAAIPCGYALADGGEHRFRGIQDYAVFWTADAKDAEMAYTRYFIAGQPEPYSGEANRRDFCASVRCVR